VLIQPVADLVDTPPRSSFHLATPADTRARFLALKEQLDTLLPRLRDPEHGRDVETVQALLDRLEALDASPAFLRYARGRCLQAAGRDAEAWVAFESARDADQHPIRAPARIHEILARLAREFDAVLVDPEPAFRSAAPHGLPGQDGFFVDYCHPDLQGHWLIADAVLRALARRGIPAPAPAWQFDAEPTRAETEARMGLARDAQAGSLARRGLGVLAQSYFQGEGGALDAARELFALALRTDQDCALAHAGVGFLACMEHDPGTAERELRRAHSLDPASLGPFLEAYDAHPTIRRIFEDAGISFQEGRPVPTPEPP
jgi:tetratricopeptide (TPR) repeat protein